MTSISEAFRNAREEFREFEKIAKAIQGLIDAQIRAVLQQELNRIDRIECRTKDFESIRNNYVKDYGIPSTPIDLKEFMKDAKDLVGVRVVVYYNDDVDPIRESLMLVHPLAELDEKLTIHDMNRGSRFGYRATHINFLFSDPIILNGYSQSSVGVEVQIRTILSDAWARHSHKLFYKRNASLGEELIRAFATTAALLENIDGQIEQIRRVPVESPRKAISVELSWSASYEKICNIVGAAIDEDELRTLYFDVSGQFGAAGVGDVAPKFIDDVRSAWANYGKIDFVKYGFRDLVTQLKIALYGVDRARYGSLIALHLRTKIDNLLQVGTRL